MTQIATNGTTVQKDCKVSFHYHLTDDQGQTIDRSDDQPLSYIHGYQQIVAGLETAMVGHSAGDSFQVQVPPELGYGVYDEEKCFTMELGDLPEGIEIGSMLELEPDDSLPFFATIVGIEENEALLDANHELAGQQLNFDIQIVEVKSALAKEIKALKAQRRGTK
jgi:FKBP-type peptidyl-prolyl cis-trans isomerase SlyD